MYCAHTCALFETSKVCALNSLIISLQTQIRTNVLKFFTFILEKIKTCKCKILQRFAAYFLFIDSLFWGWGLPLALPLSECMRQNRCTPVLCMLFYLGAAGAGARHRVQKCESLVSRRSPHRYYMSKKCCLSSF